MEFQNKKFFIGVMATIFSYQLFASDMSVVNISSKCGESKICSVVDSKNNRSFCKSSLGKCPTFEECVASNTKEDELIYTPIYIYVKETKRPVEGANIFDHSTNTLLAKTDKEGKYDLYAKAGVVIRLVEPKYGLQNQIFTVKAVDREKAQGNMLYGDNGVAGWTLR